MTSVDRAAKEWAVLHNPEQDLFGKVEAFKAGYRFGLSEANKAINKQWASFSSGAGKWACEDIERELGVLMREGEE